MDKLKTKKFTCPIDDRIVVDIPESMQEWHTDPASGTNISIANCITPYPNSSCVLIGFGCIGCRHDKEHLLKIQQQTKHVMIDKLESLIDQLPDELRYSARHRPFDWQLSMPRSAAQSLRIDLAQVSGEFTSLDNLFYEGIKIQILDTTKVILYHKEMPDKSSVWIELNETN